MTSSRSIRTAASPVTQDWPPGGRSARSRFDQRLRGRVLGVAAQRELDPGGPRPSDRPQAAPRRRPGRRPTGPPTRPGWPGRCGRRPARSAPRATRSRVSSASATCTDSRLRGSASSCGSRIVADSSGTPAASSAAVTSTATGAGHRCTNRDSAGEEPVLVVPVPPAAQGPAAVAGPDPPVREADQRRGERQRRQHRHHRDRHAGRAQRRQRPDVEHQQPGQRRRDRQGAEQHRAAGRRPGPAQRVRRREPAHQLLAVPGDQQQTVVDRQPEAEQGHHGDGVLVEVGDQGEPEQHAASRRPPTPRRRAPAGRPRSARRTRRRAPPASAAARSVRPAPGRCAPARWPLVEQPVPADPHAGAGFAGRPQVIGDAVEPIGHPGQRRVLDAGPQPHRDQ